MKTKNPKIEKFYWRVPRVFVGIPQQLALTKILDKDIEILLPFRSWQLIEHPTTNIIVAFQTDKRTK